MNPIRVLIVDDHPLMREALRAAIEDEPDMLVTAEANGGDEAVLLADSTHPDVIIMDLLMPNKDGLQATMEIISRDPDSRILILTSSSDEDKVVAAVQAGAMGYLLKDARRVDILQGIREVSMGKVYMPPTLASKLLNGLRPHRKLPVASEADSSGVEMRFEELTPRELQVLKLIGQGNSNRDIAESLFLSNGTVRTHVHHILEKLQLKNRNQAMLYAIKLQLVNDPEDHR